MDHQNFVCCEVINNGSDVNSRNRNHQTPLHCAAKRDHIDCMRQLIHRGADVNAVERDNWSVLHYAAFSSSLDCVKVLVENGANIECENITLETPLQLALAVGHLPTIEYLISVSDIIDPLCFCGEIAREMIESHNQEIKLLDVKCPEDF
jgi:ankyrin repeat protein